jgi:transposase
MNNSVIGMDISKRFFEVCEMTLQGKVLNRKKLRRGEVLEYFCNKEARVIAMESCGGSHYWGRKLMELGHEVKLIPPQFVKPFVKSNKNDRADAEAIAEAAMRANMRFVEIKSIEQQDIQHRHRVRSRLYKQRAMANNELRGMLLEYGIALNQGKKALKDVPELLMKHSSDITRQTAELMLALRDEIIALDERLDKSTKELEQLAEHHPVTKRLMTIPGVGPIIASAVVAAVGNPAAFKNGRQFSAFLGLVPRHTGTAGKNKILGISKRGDSYIRMQLVHGARSILYRSHLRKDRLGQWAQNLKAKRGWNKAAVALANKNARIIWAILRYEKDYTPLPIAA